MDTRQQHNKVVSTDECIMTYWLNKKWDCLTDKE